MNEGADPVATSASGATGSNPAARLPKGQCGCPIDAAFEVLGQKWSLLIVRNLLAGNRRFNQLLAGIEGINPKMLSCRLKELEREQLVARCVTATSPVRVEYELTERGYAILPVLRSMVRWSLTWAPERIFEDGRRPADVETCLEEWQARTLPAGTGVDVRRAEDVVGVAFVGRDRAASRRRTA